MFNFSSSLSDVSDEICDNSSIWNSAGLSSTELNPNLPEISKLSSQFDPSSFLPNSLSEKTVGLNSFQKHGTDFQFPTFTPSAAAFGTIGSKPTFTTDPNRVNTKSLSPKAVSEPRSPTQPPVSKDPGYFSESECSSNSSERDTLAHSLLVDTTTSQDTAVPHPDESWKTIKKPANKEKSIVPDLGEPSEGLWSGMASPALDNITWSMENLNKPSFVQSTKQQVCVFCRNNGEDPTVYTTHTLMSTAGKVICPILYAYKCPVCNATGDYAHTLKYCPVMPKGFGTPAANPPGGADAPAGAARFSGGASRYPNLPKTATFPKHLSSTARANMSMSQNIPFRSAPLQQQQQPNLGNFSSIADLQEAAQKILMFTNQVLQTPGTGAAATPNSPQVSQFLLKLDKGNTGNDNSQDFGQRNPRDFSQRNPRDDFTKFLQKQSPRSPSTHFNPAAGRFPLSPGFGGTSTFNPPTPTFNPPTSTFNPPTSTFNPPSFSDYSSDNPGNDLLKLLGVRKPEAELPPPPTEAEKETTLARILANLREYENKKSY